MSVGVLLIIGVVGLVAWFIYRAFGGGDTYYDSSDSWFSGLFSSSGGSNDGSSDSGSSDSGSSDSSSSDSGSSDSGSSDS
jgi:hypothetical protein